MDYKQRLAVAGFILVMVFGIWYIPKSYNEATQDGRLHARPSATLTPTPIRPPEPTPTPTPTPSHYYTLTFAIEVPETAEAVVGT